MLGSSAIVDQTMQGCAAPPDGSTIRQAYDVTVRATALKFIGSTTFVI